MVVQEAEIGEWFRQEVLAKLSKELGKHPAGPERERFFRVMLWVKSVQDEKFFTYHGSSMLSPSVLLGWVMTREGQRQLQAKAARLQFTIPSFPEV